MKDYSEIVQDTKVLLKDYYEAMSNKDYSKARELACEMMNAIEDLYVSACSEDGEIELKLKLDGMINGVETALRRCGLKKVTD